jgi:predicted nucleic acid-binding protein
LNIIIDASSSINLHRSGMLEVVLGLTSFAFVFHMGYIVMGECGDLREVLEAWVSSGMLVMLPDNALDPEEFADVLNLYGLGLGETECMALAKQQDLCVCTDDKAARRAAAKHLGEERVLGSLRLIRECVRYRLLSAQQAHAAYETMKDQGAFLPPVSASYFDCGEK